MTSSMFMLLGGGFLIGTTVGIFWLIFYRKWQSYCERRYGKDANVVATENKNENNS